MTKSEFDRALKAAGLSRVSGPGGVRFERTLDGVRQCVARSNVHGGSVRLLLARGDVPESWPTTDLQSKQKYVEAESPWFDYLKLDPEDPPDPHINTQEQALAKLWSWYERIGAGWLATGRFEAMSPEDRTQLPTIRTLP